MPTIASEAATTLERYVVPGPESNMDLMTWVGAAVACTLVILLAVVILGHRIDKVTEQLIDLRLLQINMQPVDNDQRRVLAALGALAETLPELRSVSKGIDEVKRQHADLSSRMEAVVQAHGELHAVARALDEIRTSQSELSARMQMMAQGDVGSEAVVGALDEIRAGQSTLSERMPTISIALEAIKTSQYDLSAHVQTAMLADGGLDAMISALNEIKKTQGELSVRMQAAAQVDGDLRAVASALAEIKASQSESMKAVGSMANLIQRWCSGMNNAAAEVERSVRSVTPVIPIEAPVHERR